MSENENNHLEIVPKKVKVKKTGIGTWIFTNSITSNVTSTDFLITNTANRSSTISIPGLINTLYKLSNGDGTVTIPEILRISTLNSVFINTSSINVSSLDGYNANFSTLIVSTINGLPYSSGSTVPSDILSISTLNNIFTNTSSINVSSLVGYNANFSTLIVSTINGLPYSGSGVTGPQGPPGPPGAGFNSEIYVAVGISATPVYNSIRREVMKNFATIQPHYVGSNRLDALSHKLRYVYASTFSTHAIKPHTGLGYQNYPSILYSTDSLNWNTASYNSSFMFGYDVAFNGTTWVTVGISCTNPYSAIQVSSDGINWSSTNFSQNLFGGLSVSYSPQQGLWIASGIGSIFPLVYSSNGYNWNTIETLANNNITRIRYLNNMWFGMGPGDGSGTNYTSTILYSPDGFNWSNINSGGFSNSKNGGPFWQIGGIGIAYGNGLYVATGATGGDFTSSIQYSSDGSNWYSSASGGFDGSIGIDVAYGNGIWVAVGVSFITSNYTILTSFNGSNWLPVNSGGFNIIQGNYRGNYGLVQA
jgi:hypothetical protein